MKQLFSIITFLFCLTIVQAEPVFLQTFKPAERVHDFGQVYEKNGKVSTVFTFTNTGSKPVAISDVNTWCGCMAVDYTKKAIRPGETATMKVVLDPDHKSGSFIKQIVLLLNDGTSYVRVWVKANIIPMQHPVTETCPYDFGYGLYMDQMLLPFPNYDKGSDFSINLKLANNTDKPMTVTLSRNPNNTVLKMPEKVELKAHEVKTIRASYHFYHRYTKNGYVFITPTINGKKSTRTLKVKWNGSQKFQLNN